ncbi:MAG: hypothetical protein V4622_09475 [Bacteroidota bacterium]
MKEYEGRYAYYLMNDTITFVTILTKHIDLEIAKEIIRDRIMFSGDDDANLLVDNTRIKTIDKAARDYFGSEESNQKLNIMAIYANTTLSVFLANFVIKISMRKYTVPIRLFTDKNKAIEWIKSKN